MDRKITKVEIKTIGFNFPLEELCKHSTIRPITYYENSNGCHICTSHKNKVKGYPMISRKGHGSSEAIVRYLYRLKFGEIQKGYEICHKCDNPACINLEHIWLGTHKENMMDMVRKGRWNPKSAHIGENNVNAKLTDSLVRYIRTKVFKHGEVIKFCRENNITNSLFYMVKKEQIWKHVIKSTT